MSKEAHGGHLEWRGRVSCPCKCGGTVAVHASLYKGRSVDVDMFLIFDELAGEQPPATHCEEVLRTYNLGAELGLEMTSRFRNRSGD